VKPIVIIIYNLMLSHVAIDVYVLNDHLNCFLIFTTYRMPFPENVLNLSYVR